jgi:DNA-directed RNA polymerase sigma subunit (sigma70/sigma32)
MTEKSLFDTLEDLIAQKQIEEMLEHGLSNMSEEEKYVITKRFGLFGETPCTFKELLDDMNATFNTNFKNFASLKYIENKGIKKLFNFFVKEKKIRTLQDVI